MKIFAFLVCLGLFVGAFALLGYSFAMTETWLQIGLFSAGLLAVAVSLMIPFHLLEKFD
jgi:hypothetical protein